MSAWSVGSFFVNLANDAPEAPVPLAPADGEVVATASPTLRVRNAVDIDRDALSYEFEVSDAGGAVIDAVSGIAEGSSETEWVVSVALDENAVFTWRARAADGEVESEWSTEQSFRVNAIDEPPTAPVPVNPAEGALLEEAGVSLVVESASSPDLLALTYEFQLFRVESDGSLTLFAEATGLPEGSDQTGWTLPTDPVDANYSWRARAVDANQPGPWSASAHFTAAIDVPPAAPMSVQAAPADGSIALSWAASPEADVVSYNVYRAEASGGPYALAGSPALPTFADAGLVNGITQYYVVTAVDLRFESPFSSEVAATAVPVLSGTLLATPSDVLAGDAFSLSFTVRNDGAVTAVGVVVTVDAGVLGSSDFGFDLDPGRSGAGVVTLQSAGLGFGPHGFTLRSASPAQVLAAATLVVHGPVSAPSVDSPADGARVPTDRPELRVNNGANPDGSPLTYEFELYSDAGFTNLVAGKVSVAETPDRTSWTLLASLVENAVYYWRARATDGLTLSPWTTVSSFRVDQADDAPSAPVPDSPDDGARVGTREPTLVVANGVDPEGDAVGYEFQVASDAGFSQIATSATGLPEGVGTTGWLVPTMLDEDARYYWRARATAAGLASDWSETRSFIVDTFDGAPSAPVTSSPPDGSEAPTLTPSLTVANAVDPEGRPLSYRFEIDEQPSFDSPALQSSPDVAEGVGQTSWTPPGALIDNSDHHWRALAFDGVSEGPWVAARFFVNLANDAPSAPTPREPADGAVVMTAKPTLRVGNAADLDRDALTYEFRVLDASGAIAAQTTGVLEGALETAWTLPGALAENGIFTWQARANDGEAAGPWSAPFSFRVNAIDEPPTAPTLSSPLEGVVLDSGDMTLVGANAESPDLRPLSYRFELYAVGAAGDMTLVAQAAGLPEGADSTAWSPGFDLDDGAYSWRARAEDGLLVGPWMTSARFDVAVDVPPGAPTGLTAAPGDSSVALSWTARPEPEVALYRVYRSLTTGGPYSLIASVIEPSRMDAGLANGTTYYYVVTAFDGRFDSAFSNEVAATPLPVTEARIRLKAKSIKGKCLLAASDAGSESVRSDDDGDDDDSSSDDDSSDDESSDHRSGGRKSPTWLEARIELSRGFDASTIDVASVRLEGAVAADPDYLRVRGGRHRNRHVSVRFAFEAVVPLLEIGRNELSVTGSGAGFAFRGEGRVEVKRLSVRLEVEPQNFESGKKGKKDVRAAVVASLSFDRSLKAEDVELESIRLNGSVVPERLIAASGRHLEAGVPARGSAGDAAAKALRDRDHGDDQRGSVRGKEEGICQMRSLRMKATNLVWLAILTPGVAMAQEAEPTPTPLREGPVDVVIPPAEASAPAEEMEMAQPELPEFDRSVKKVRVGGSPPAVDLDSTHSGVLKGARALDLKPGEARVIVGGSERVLHVGDAIGDDVVKSIDPGRIVLIRSPKPGNPKGDALVWVDFDPNGASLVRVMLLEDPTPKAPAVR